MPTKIQWTDESWNPLRATLPGGGPVGWHCEIITPGCERCYAQAINKRLGTKFPYKRSHRTDVRPFLDEKILKQPLRWKRPRRIFVCSMSDLFGEWVTHDMLKRIFSVMRDAPQHTYQILTKRTARMRDFMQWWVMQNVDQPPENWWFGGSVEDQRRADERIPEILSTPAAVRWVSAEPLLEGVDLMWAFWRRMGLSEMPCHALNDGCTEGITLRRPGINWVVCGGESGPGARPFNIEWARSIIAQCKDAGVACFVKQLGAKPTAHHSEIGRWASEGSCSLRLTGSYPDYFIQLRDRKGGAMEEWPEDIRIREYPDPHPAVSGQSQEMVI